MLIALTPDMVFRASKALYRHTGHGERCSPECVDHWEHESVSIRSRFITQARIALEAALRGDE